MNNFWLKTISLTEIIGGGCGVLLTIYFIFVTKHTAFSFAIFPILFAINFMCLFAGIFLWKKNVIGRKLSIITQFIHLPKIVSPLLTFMFSFGIDIYPYAQFWDRSSKMGIEFKLIAFYQFYINMQNAPIGFGLNIVAIAFLIMLFRYDPTDLESFADEIDLPPTLNKYSDVGGNI